MSAIEQQGTEIEIFLRDYQRKKDCSARVLGLRFEREIAHAGSRQCSQSNQEQSQPGEHTKYRRPLKLYETSAGMFLHPHIASPRRCAHNRSILWQSF